MHATIWRAFTDALHAEFPDTTIILIRRHYHPWSRTRMLAYIDEIVRAHDDGSDTLLIGHSMGGIVAMAIAERLQRAQVRAVVTIFSPHRLLGGLFSRQLDSLRVKAPLITFGALPDRMVPYGAKHPDSVLHTVFFTDHLWGLKWRAVDIARIIRQQVQCTSTK